MVKEDIISSENIEEFDSEMVEITDPYYINAWKRCRIFIKVKSTSSLDLEL